MKKQKSKHSNKPCFKIPVKTGKRIFSTMLSCVMTLGGLTQSIPVFASTAALNCSFQIHEHTKDCYDTKPECGLEEDEEHVHTKDCFPHSEPQCGLADFVVHTHDEHCYDENGTLQCTLPEIEEHVHTEDCYQEERVLDCTLDHTHTDSCYRMERTLICDKPEIELHTHDEHCYDKDGQFVCGKLQVLKHQHTDACWTNKEPVDSNTNKPQETEKTDNGFKEWLSGMTGGGNKESSNGSSSDRSEHSSASFENHTGSSEESDEDEEDPDPSATPSDEQSNAPLQGEMVPVRKSARNQAAASIEEFNLKFSNGGTLNTNDAKYGWDEDTKSYQKQTGTSAYLWNPSDPVKDHQFAYRMDYTINGAVKAGELSFTLPLHILKDRNGEWADEFDCPYVTADQQTPTSQFVYTIDEVRQTATIVNAQDLPTGAHGFIEVGWATTRSTLDYFDMGISKPVEARLSLTKTDGSAAEKSAKADPVGLDTHASIASTSMKSNPTYYESWQESWGMDRPEDADDFYYLVWTVYSVTAKNTSPYTFIFNDTFEDFGGSAIGYRFAGQGSFISENHIDNVRDYGARYDYVLVRYSKAQAQKALETSDRYTVHNCVKTIVDPTDAADANSSATSSASWFYEIPKYVSTTGHFWAEKYGLYPANGNYQVWDSEDIASYNLAEFVEGKDQTLDGLRYRVYVEGYPYPWTADAPLTGTEEDVAHYGQKAVDYHLVDEAIQLEGETLNPADYDLAQLDWTLSMSDAQYDAASKQFVSAPIVYTDTDILTFFVKKANGNFVPAAQYNLKTNAYLDVDAAYVQSASGKSIQFQSGVKGYRVDFSNAHYYSRFTAYPTLTLNRTDHVLQILKPIIGQGKVQKAAVTNTAVGSVTQEGSTIFSRKTSAEDYVQAVIRNGQLRKDVISTKNDKLNRLYQVTWSDTLQETYQDNDGFHYVPQISGTFYDLLPSGSLLEMDSLQVYAGSKLLNPGDYTVNVFENYRGSGRTMLNVQLQVETATTYSVRYTTIYTWNLVQDYGKRLHSSIAYQTSNPDIADGLGDMGGDLEDQNWMKDLDPELSDSQKKFLFAQANYDVNVLLAADIGLSKMVHGGSDAQYSSSSSTTNAGTYSYAIRYANGQDTRAKDIVFFDSLENYFVPGNHEPVIASDWHGTLTGIDTTQLQSKGVAVKLYGSSVENLQIADHHDLSDTSIWKLIDASTDLSTIRAIAVDAQTDSTGNAFILDKGDSLTFTLYMKAPASDTSSSAEPTAYNNIYVDSTSFNELGDPGEKTCIHQDYTKISYRISGSAKFKKVNAENPNEPVAGMLYELSGTSQYGTAYNIRRATNANGEFRFDSIEKGTYTLKEVESNADWLLDEQVYTVEIDADGSAWINSIRQEDGQPFILTDKPRVHADLNFLKTNALSGETLSGAQFCLTGTSDYGNDLLKTAVSDLSGKVTFQDIEKGTYTLTETNVLEGYVPNTHAYTVKVDVWGVASLWLDGSPIQADASGWLHVENEPLHSITFLKRSSYGTNIYLEGAEFELSGVSDLGTEVHQTAVSESKDNLGRVTFDGLEPGTYQLKETKAPKDLADGTTFNVDAGVHTVVLQEDGSYTISGLNQIALDDQQVYVFDDVPQTGMVTITKQWQDDSSDADRNQVDNIPDVELMTKAPEDDGTLYRVTFDAGDGQFADGSKQMTLLYTGNGRPLQTGYKLPDSTSLVFDGWTDAQNETVEVDGNGNLQNVVLHENMTLKAKWTSPVLMKGADFNALLLAYNCDLDTFTSGVEEVYIGTGASIPSLEIQPHGSISGKDRVDFSDQYLLDVSAKQDGSVVAWANGSKIYVEAIDHKTILFNASCVNMFRSGSRCTLYFNNQSYYKGFKHNFSSIELGSNIDTSKVTNMSSMFEGCSNLTSLDVSGFDTSNVTNMSYMFEGCSSLTSLDVSQFDTGSVTRMSYMFYGCQALTSLDLSHFDTSKVTNMYWMFYNCRALTSLDVSGFDTSSVTGMNSMFYNCRALTSLDVSHFDTSKVTDMSYMFYGCQALTSLDVSHFDTSSVTGMNSMFYNCRALTSLDVSGFDTSSVTGMNTMFYNCSSLTSLDVSQFDTGSVTNMSYMFEGCSKLTSLDLSHFDTSKVTNMSSMFEDCSKLTTIYANDWYDAARTVNSSNMFYECSSLVGRSASGNKAWSSSTIDWTMAQVGPNGYFTNPALKP